MRLRQCSNVQITGLCGFLKSFHTFHLPRAACLPDAIPKRFLKPHRHPAFDGEALKTEQVILSFTENKHKGMH
jgi:hypothetical protein